jgi:hypothetical protein
MFLSLELGSRSSEQAALCENEAYGLPTTFPLELILG